MDDGMASIISEGYDAGVRLGESLAEHMVAIPSPRRWNWWRWPRRNTSAVTARPPCQRIWSTTTASLFATQPAAPFIMGVFHYRAARAPYLSVEPQGSMITNDDDGMIRAALQHVGIIQHFDFAVKAWWNAVNWCGSCSLGRSRFPASTCISPPVSTCLPRSGRCWTFWSRSAQAKPAHAPYHATACAAPPPVWR